jgi:hypothetical protein
MSLAAFTTVRRRSPRHLIAALFLTLCLAFLSACGGSAPATPTPKPAAPKATTAPTSKPAAKASPAAGASPAASPGASPSPSPVAENPIEILDATLADATPWVSLKLDSGEPVIVSGWRLEVGTQSVVIPGNAILNPGDTLTLRAGEGRSSDREIYLGAESHQVALAASPGARVRLVDTTGRMVAETTGAGGGGFPGFRGWGCLKVLRRRQPRRGPAEGGDSLLVRAILIPYGAADHRVTYQQE